MLHFIKKKTDHSRIRTAQESANAPGKFAALTDQIHKWAQVLAILAGGIWAYYHFVLAGASDWDVTLGITTEVIPYSKDLKLLVVHVRSENRTERVVEIAKPDDSFTLTIRKVPDGLTAKAIAETDKGELLATRDLLPEIDSWQFMPKSRFEDTFGVILPAKTKVALQATLIHDGDYSTASEIVSVEEKTEGNSQNRGT